MSAQIHNFPTKTLLHIPSEVMNKLAYNLMLAAQVFLDRGDDENAHDLIDAADRVAGVGRRLEKGGL